MEPLINNTPNLVEGLSVPINTNQTGLLQLETAIEKDKVVTILNGISDTLNIIPRGIEVIIYLYADILNNVVDYCKETPPSQEALDILKGKGVEVVHVPVPDGATSASREQFVRLCKLPQSITIYLQNRPIEYRPGSISDKVFDSIDSVITQGIVGTFGGNKTERDKMLTIFQGILEGLPGTENTSTRIVAQISNAPLHMEACVINFAAMLEERVGPLVSNLGQQLKPEATTDEIGKAFMLAAKCFVIPRVEAIVNQLIKLGEEGTFFLGNVVKAQFTQPTIEVVEEASK